MFDIDVDMSMGHMEAVTILFSDFLHIQLVMAHIMDLIVNIS